jgi:hypothetical protein
VPTAIVFVKTKNVAVVPVPVAIVAEADPADAVTGAAAVAVARMIEAFVAVTVTAVPVSTVAIKRKASVASTELSDGTGSATAAVLDKPLFAGAEPLTAIATVIGAALAGVATIVPKVMAATIPRAIFLNEFIFLLIRHSLFILIYIDLGNPKHRLGFP